MGVAAESRSTVRLPILAGLVRVDSIFGASADYLGAEPFDQSARNAGFAAFLKRVEDAVDDQDTDAVVAAARPDVEVFNDPDGVVVETLRKQLTDSRCGADADAHWAEIGRAMPLSGGFLADGRYCAPDVYAYSLPSATDNLSDAFVIRDRAKLYD